MNLQRTNEIHTNEMAMRISDLFIAVVWLAVTLGLLEGVLLVGLRVFPEIHAAKKTSTDVMWIAPVLHLLICLIIVLPATTVIVRLQGRLRKWILIFTYGLIGFIGSFSVVMSTGIIHIAAAAILAVGFASLLSREFAKRRKRVFKMMRKWFLIVPLLLVLAWLVSFVHTWAREAWMDRQRPKPSSNAPNIVLIVLDTVRYDVFGPKDELTLTPNMDHIATEGVFYEQAWPTSSWSLSSQASILTGYYPHEHGASWPNFTIDPNAPTLAEFLYRRGYATSAFSGNSAWVTPEYLGRGFMRFKAYTLEDIARRTTIGKVIDRILGQIGMHDAGRGAFAPMLHRQLIAFLDDYPENPFFIFLCYMDVNQVLYGQKFNSRWGKIAPVGEVYEAYKLGIRVLDAYIGNLFDMLCSCGKLDNTIIVITSDHGQSFGPEIQNDRDPLGHGTSLYPEQCHVPLIVWYPEKLRGDTTIRSTVSLCQIPSTLVHLLGLDDSPFSGDPIPMSMDGKGIEDNDRSALLTLSYAGRNIRSIVSNGLQYIISKNKDGNATEELFHVAEVQSPTQVSSPDTNLMREMRVKLHQYLPDDSTASGDE